MTSTINFTKAECEIWIDNKNINPKTNRNIKIKGPTYMSLVKACEKYNIILENNAYKSKKKTTSKRSPLSTKINIFKDSSNKKKPKVSLLKSVNSKKSQSPKTRSPRSKSPKTRSPRSKSPKTRSPRSQSPKTRSPRSKSPKTRSPRSQSPKTRSPRSQSPKTRSPRSKSPKTRSPRSQSPKTRSPRSQSPKTRSPRSQSPKTRSPRSQSPKTRSPRSQSPKTRSPRSQSPKTRSPRSQSPKTRSPRSQSPKTQKSKPIPVSPQTERKAIKNSLKSLKVLDSQTSRSTPYIIKGTSTHNESFNNNFIRKRKEELDKEHLQPTPLYKLTPLSPSEEIEISDSDEIIEENNEILDKFQGINFNETVDERTINDIILALGEIKNKKISTFMEKDSFFLKAIGAL